MKNIGICVNLQKDVNFCVTKNIISIIEKLGSKCEIATDGKEYDFVISLGGDGTFLSTSRRFWNSPIVGINLGNLGFLSEIDKDNMETELEKLLNGDFRIEERFLLETEIYDKKLYALNDVVISRGFLTKLLNLEVYFDNKFVDNYVADGIIVSTPTGSTAYSLSAGGPIVEPNLDVLVISPICAHSLHHRPIIIGSDTEIRIAAKKNGFMVMVDGQEYSDGKEIQEIVIRRSDKRVKVIKTKGNCFFDTVRNKFHIKKQEEI